MKTMKLTSMKSFVFLSGLKHTHKSDVHGPSLENHFLVSKVAWTMGTGETRRHRHSWPDPSGFLWVNVLSCWYGRRGSKQQTWGHNDNSLISSESVTYSRKTERTIVGLSPAFSESPDSYFLFEGMCYWYMKSLSASWQMTEEVKPLKTRKHYLQVYWFEFSKNKHRHSPRINAEGKSHFPGGLSNRTQVSLMGEILQSLFGE